MECDGTHRYEIINLSFIFTAHTEREEVLAIKISINAGHTAAGAGYGAEYKGFRESEINRAVVAALIPKLQKLGHTVHNSTVDKATTNKAYLSQAVKSSNNSGAELFLSIHCNASAAHTGYGVECWTYKGAPHPAAKRICANMAKLGFRNRGIKDGRNLYVVKNTTAKAILIELFFLDNYTDRKLYLELGADKIAQAIADAIGK
jgi:N-acetylmuramoyl-L-alanine amidase